MKSLSMDSYYEEKAPNYFSGVRWDYVNQLPNNPDARILELGCGSGDTGAASLAEGKCGWCSGIELSEQAAKLAREQLSEVVVGNVELIELPWPENSFDALVISEVLEHLVDPWSVLRRLHHVMKPGALVFASSPNISHHKVIRMLLSGKWELKDFGVMDRTHLRWFTPRSYRLMFEECGYQAESVVPVTPMSRKTRAFNALTGGRLQHLFFVQISLRARVVK